MNADSALQAEREADEADEAPDPREPHAAASPWEAAEPPGAEELGVDVAGLPPARARLARFIAWIERTRRELQDMTDGRARLLEEAGVPAVTEKKIRELVDNDTMGLVSWMRAGAKAPSEREIRKFERAQLEEKLKGDRHAAEVARAALDAIEVEIEGKRRQLTELEGRREDFAADAVLEHADAVGAAYLLKVDELRDLLGRLNGLAVVLRNYRRYRPSGGPAETPIPLPSFGLPSFGAPRPGFTLKIDPSAEDMQAAARPWRELLKRWGTDAHAPGIVDQGAMSARPASRAAPEIKPAIATYELPEHLQDAADEIAASGSADDWTGRAELVDGALDDLRAAGALMGEHDAGAIIAFAIEAWGSPEVTDAAQATLYQLSAGSQHRRAAAAWLAERAA
jgi:hypothetical protein